MEDEGLDSLSFAASHGAERDAAIALRQIAERILDGRPLPTKTGARLAKGLLSAIEGKWASCVLGDKTRTPAQKPQRRDQITRYVEAMVVAEELKSSGREGGGAYERAANRLGRFDHAAPETLKKNLQRARRKPLGKS
jgi:hypothetical protein